MNAITGLTTVNPTISSPAGDELSTMIPSPTGDEK